jgi:uncharacterized protein
MTFTHTTHPVQQRPSGEVYAIHAYHLEGSRPGPRIYIQANVHGPEICGTAVLLQLMHDLEKLPDCKGRITIVPSANPVGLNQVTYNGMIGRYNVQSGINWNRIFSVPRTFASEAEDRTYWQERRDSANRSVEAVLAAELRLLAAGAEYVLDIHTTGVACAEHLFTFSWMHDTYARLGTPFHIEIPADSPVGAFDESMVLPYLATLGKDLAPKAATWEIHHHGHVDAAVVAARVVQLKRWIAAVQGTVTAPTVETQPRRFTDGVHLNAPLAGYYEWHAAIGAEVPKGAVYARVYQPWIGTWIDAEAPFAFVLLGQYGVGAQAEGEQIAYVAKVL